MEEENRKKLTLKDRKVQELEQKLGDLKEDQSKNKSQYEINLEKIQANLAAKCK
jgi:hypothetical protein